MKSTVKCLVSVVFILSIITGSAFAGFTHVNYQGATNTPFAISAETLGISRDFTITSLALVAGANVGALNVPLSFQLTQNMTTQNLLQVSLSGAAFNGAQIFMCAPVEFGPTDAANLAAGNVQRIGVGTPTADATAFNFQSSAAVSQGNFVFLTSTPCAVGGNIFGGSGNANMPIRIPAFTPVGMSTVTLSTVTAGNLAVDPASTDSAANVAREYAVALTTRGMIIDYLNAFLDGPANGTTFVQGASSNVLRTNGGATSIFNVTRTVTNYNAVADAGLTPGFSTTTNTATDWSGTTNVFLSNGATNCAANLGAITTSPSGAVTNTARYPGNAVAANVYDICINVNGTTELVARSINGSYGVTVTGSGANPAAAAVGDFQTWTINAFQAYVPHMRWDTAGNTRTFVRVVNRDTREVGAQVSVQLNNTAPVTYSLGTVPARGIVTYSANTIAQDNGITDESYAALFTVKSSVNNVYAEAFFNLVGYGTRNAVLYENPTGKVLGLK